MLVLIDLCICVLPYENTVVEDERLEGNTFHHAVEILDSGYHAIRCKDRIKEVLSLCLFIEVQQYGSCHH